MFKVFVCFTKKSSKSLFLKGLYEFLVYNFSFFIFYLQILYFFEFCKPIIQPKPYFILNKNYFICIFNDIMSETLNFQLLHHDFGLQFLYSVQFTYYIFSNFCKLKILNKLYLTRIKTNLLTF